MEETNKKILLCEDEEFLARSYSYGLTAQGYTVSVAINGVEAIEKVKSVHPDLILLDLLMPLKTGFEVLEEIKANPETAEIPVIVTSNLAQESDIARAKEMGAADYLVKSNSALKDFFDVIEKYLA